MYFDPGNGEFVAIDGQIVERKTLYLVEKIKDLDPNLEVICLNPELASDITEEPFLICERVGDRLLKIFGVWELNDSVLERIRLADTSRHNILDVLAKKEQAIRDAAERRYKEKREEAVDLVTSIAKNRKSSFTHIKDDGTKVTFYEDRPTEVKKAG